MTFRVGGFAPCSFIPHRRRYLTQVTDEYVEPSSDESRRSSTLELY
jgi:hypothetical protein